MFRLLCGATFWETFALGTLASRWMTDSLQKNSSREKPNQPLTTTGLGPAGCGSQGLQDCSPGDPLLAGFPGKGAGDGPWEPCPAGEDAGDCRAAGGAQSVPSGGKAACIHALAQCQDNSRRQPGREAGQAPLGAPAVEKRLLGGEEGPAIFSARSRRERVEHAQQLLELRCFRDGRSLCRLLRELEGC